MAGLERLWAGWRSDYLQSSADSPGDDASGDDVTDPGAGEHCPFCRILASGKPDDETYVVWRGGSCFAILNAYPYASGHLLVMPYRHVGELEALSDDEADEAWRATRTAVVAVRRAYAPDGLNVGANLGRAAGAGVPGHLHLHMLPRWTGDSNFMTSVAEARVLPEALPTTYARLREAWPAT